MSHSPAPETAQHHHRARSIPSPANGANFCHKDIPTHPQALNSPPLSSSGSQVGLAVSPRPLVLTPPASVPMSADPSQQSITAAAPSTTGENLEVAAPRWTASPTRPSTMEPIHPQTQRQPSLKRSLEADPLDHVSNKRRRTGEEVDAAERTEVEQPNPSSSVPLYRLNTTTLSRARPHPSENLLSLYKLDDVAAGLARHDPATGDKINKLRKSYEGKIKDLGVPGKNKATSNFEEMMNLVGFPDEEWQVQKVHGKDLRHGLGENMLAKLDAALKIDPGRLPQDENDKWRSAIGIDEGLPKSTVPSQGSKKPTEPGATTQPGTPSSAATNNAVRPLRRGTKRRYNDDSFEGYGEGFVDDNGELITVDGDESSSKKRRKDAIGSPTFSTGLNQYATSSVSVGGGQYQTR
ncbi:MAG: hypothetical protein M1828_006514 [Chrysothrix sp. TS-e1954]|nr:MAG: hypothetical protein M1828_006514 [Chrysothrix sp. TS-e1954]